MFLSCVILLTWVYPALFKNSGTRKHYNMVFQECLREVYRCGGGPFIYLVELCSIQFFSVQHTVVILHLSCAVCGVESRTGSSIVDCRCTVSLLECCQFYLGAKNLIVLFVFFPSLLPTMFRILVYIASTNHSLPVLM